MAESSKSKLSILSCLPAEVLQHTFIDLTVQQLQNLRLVNSKICSIASRKLFSSITIRDSEFSKMKLENITSDPFWVRQVRSVDWLSITSSGGRQSFGADIPGFDIDCQLEHLRKMSNLDTVKFATHDIGNGYVDYTAECSPRNLLQRAMIAPATVMIDTMPLTLGYTKNREMESLRIGADTLPFDVIEAQQRISAFNLVVDLVAESSNDIEWTKPARIAKDFATISSATLKRITLRNISILSGFLSEMLQAQPQLTQLNLQLVMLAPLFSYDPEPLEQFLMEWKDHAKLHETRSVQLSLHKVRKSLHIGDLSAEPDEIAAWMEGKNEDWLKNAQASFKRIGDDNDEDSEFDVGGFSDFENEYDYGVDDYDIDNDSDFDRRAGD